MMRTRCPSCKKKLESGQRIHPGCVDAYADQQAAKAERAKAKAVKAAQKDERETTRARKEALKSRSDWMKDAQKAVNAFVRARDSGLPCISCGRYHQGEIHGGHYLSRGAHPELALDERNIHAQCQPCNVHLSGNQINYRKGLIARHGVELVEWLEGAHSPKKYTIDQLKEIARTYKAKLKELQK
jgi:hypothetical protein